jgi:serine/threonine protein kinase
MVQLQGLRYMHAVSSDNAPIPVVALTGWPEGSHAFCPPKGELHSESADIWSLGILLYFLLAGMLPYRGSNREMAKAKGLIKYDTTMPSPAAQDLIEHMLHADSRHRFTIQQVLEHEWMSESDERLVAFDLSLTRSIVSDWPKLDPKCQNCSKCRRLLAFTS